MVEVALALVGPGLVGSTLLTQIAHQARTLAERYGIHLSVNAITSSKRMVLSREGLDLSSWRQQLDTMGSSGSLEKLTEFLGSSNATNQVVIDCTASDAIPEMYSAWAERGFHIITPNKKMGSGTKERFEGFQRICRAKGVQFLCESTVGAGLPVISTLRSLLDTGDRVDRIEGVLSGTLSYIFSSYHPPSNSFSQVVEAAKAAGYTEPDPRDDLSGMDVARKVAILGRECGLEVELSALQVKSLVPEALRGVQGVEEFMSRLPEFDSDMEREAASALAEGSVIRYVGVVDVAAGKCEVALRRYPNDHPLAQLKGSDNMISFVTQRYSSNPLIVRGPGAGAEVTAAGIFADLVQLCRMLPRPAAA